MFNKIDLSGEQPGLGELDGIPVVYLSAKQHIGIDLLRQQLRRRWVIAAKAKACSWRAGGI